MQDKITKVEDDCRRLHNNTKTGLSHIKIEIFYIPLCEDYKGFGSI